jgi:hypothetical protein
MHKGEEPRKPPKLSSQNDETISEIIEEIVKPRNQTDCGNF